MCTGVTVAPAAALLLRSQVDSTGLTQGDNFKLPVTQARLADALGLTPVHVNRMLKQLCGSGLITLRGRTVRITDWDGLRIAGEFTPDYLYLGQNSQLQRPPGDRVARIGLCTH
jgi:hypothetical protein